MRHQHCGVLFACMVVRAKMMIAAIRVALCSRPIAPHTGSSDVYVTITTDQALASHILCYSDALCIYGDSECAAARHA